MNADHAIRNETVPGTKITLGEVTDFYYTYEWSGYNAEYQRYRFYAEDGKHYFYHEARAIKGDYAWGSEAPLIGSGTVELSEDEWDEFLSTISKGRADKPDDDLVDGDSGPWLYLYYVRKGENVQMKFSFGSSAELKSFEEYCEAIAARG